MESILREYASDYYFESEFFPERANLKAKRLAAMHAPCIDELVRLARESELPRLSPEQWESFIGDLEWGQNLIAGGLDAIYQQFLYFDERHDSGDGSIIATWLYRWLMDHEYPAIQFKTAMGYGLLDGKPNVRRLIEVAENGYLPAIIEMAQRTLSGDGLAKDRGTAWYWLKRAQQGGADISSVTQQPLQEMLLDLNDEERWSLTYAAHYYGDLDLTGIAIPASFSTLSLDVPPPLTATEIAQFKKMLGEINPENDTERYQAFMGEFSVRTLGIRYVFQGSIHNHVRPLGMSDAEFIQRKCRFNTAIDKVFWDGQDERVSKLTKKVEALTSYLFDGTIRDEALIRHVANVCPNRESKAFADAVDWVKELSHLPPLDLRQRAAKHFKESGSLSTSKYESAQGNADSPKTQLDHLHFVLSKLLEQTASMEPMSKGRAAKPLFHP